MGERIMWASSLEYEQVWTRYVTARRQEEAISSHMDACAMDARDALALAKDNEAIAWHNYKMSLQKEEDDK